MSKESAEFSENAGDCVTLWIGSSLGPVERACLRSTLRHGHSIALYCYNELHGVPEGVELRDASEVLPRDDLLFHRPVRPGVFADWFRLALQKRGLGTWLDLDMYLLAPLDLAHPYLLAEEEPGLINNAVLRLPADCPILPLLLEPFEKRKTPDWLPWHWYLPAKVREIVTGEADFSRMPWGSTGAYGLTALARTFGLYSYAYPPEVFYPSGWRNSAWIANPAIQLEDVITERTVGIHLSNECIKNFKNLPARKGTFLARLQQEGRE